MRLKASILILAGFASFQLMASNLWASLAEKDIHHIYKTIQQNHPGYVDQQNPYFKRWLEQGYKEALEQSAKATSLNDAMTVIQTYIAGFGDGHLYLNLYYQPKKLKWAGIQLKKIAEDYRVAYVDKEHNDEMPAINSRLISCDSRSVNEIMANDVLKYRFNTPEINSPKVRLAADILVDDGIGKRSFFSSCLFNQGGKETTIKLKWRNINQADYQDRTKSAYKQSSYPSIEAFGEQRYWVRLPRFNLNLAAQEKMREVIQTIKQQRESTRLFVVDVRGNRGGNSQWGVEVAKAMLGDDYIENHQKFFPDKGYALWRVSEENAKHLESLLPLIEQQFGKNKMFSDFSALTANMKRAIPQGKQLIRQREPSVVTEVEQDVSEVAASTSARILFLTDSKCGSACLDFADLMLQLPMVSHIGQETSVDTVYMDIRGVTLPSGLGRFSIAQKVYRDRARGHNQSYKPMHYFQHDVSDTDKLKDWIEQSLVK